MIMFVLGGGTSSPNLPSVQTGVQIRATTGILRDFGRKTRTCPKSRHFSKKYTIHRQYIDLSGIQTSAQLPMVQNYSSKKRTCVRSKGVLGIGSELGVRVCD